MNRRFFVTASLAFAALPRPGLAQEKILVADLYDNADFSAQAEAFNGTEIALDGFMAPPLKTDAKFFVLGTEPMAICPFCDAAAQWPQNIVLIYPRDGLKLYNFDQAITVTGKLELGVATDEETGFVSKVRIVDAVYRGLPKVSIGF